jgi:hypothetical protein
LYRILRTAFGISKEKCEWVLTIHTMNIHKIVQYTFITIFSIFITILTLSGFVNYFKFMKIKIQKGFKKTEKEVPKVDEHVIELKEEFTEVKENEINLEIGIEETELLETNFEVKESKEP